MTWPQRWYTLDCGHSSCPFLKDRAEMKPTFYLISWFLLCCFMPLGDITAIKTKIKINNNNSFHSNTQPLQCLSHYRENRVSTNSNMCCCGWGRDKLRDSRIIMPLCIFVFLALLGLQVFPRKRAQCTIWFRGIRCLVWPQEERAMCVAATDGWVHWAWNHHCRSRYLSKRTCYEHRHRRVTKTTRVIQCNVNIIPEFNHQD